ncbi:MAG: hypothetical protein Q9N26_00465 [Aquificota bacterium]|nr:hypothetical protein [Aquificota bacterium]
MWGFTLQVIKISLLEKPAFSVIFFTLLILLTLSFPVPILGQLLFLLNLFLVFSFITFTSKTVVLHGGDMVRVRQEFRRSGVLRILFSYVPETLGVLVGQFVLTLGAILVALIVLVAGGSSFLIAPLIRGEEVSWWGVLGTLVLCALLYFSVVTSFPLFFGRAVLRGSGFSATFVKFVSSLFFEVSWKTVFSCDYMRSSLVLSFVVLGLIMLDVLLLSLPPLGVLSPVISFLCFHIAYTFGTVACLRLLRS